MDNDSTELRNAHITVSICIHALDGML
jgi:hypothetical protein